MAGKRSARLGGKIRGGNPFEHPGLEIKGQSGRPPVHTTREGELPVEKGIGPLLLPTKRGELGVNRQEKRFDRRLRS